MLIERKVNSFKSMVFQCDLTAVGKLYSDVTDIFFVIKANSTTSDADAVMIKQMADGITIDSDSKVLVPWSESEYDEFTIGKTYELRLFLKFSGDPLADEDVEEEFTIKITQDFLHDA